MNCANCGTQNVAGAKFCMECAAPLASGCPNCGFVNPPSAKFCSECATALTGGGARRAVAPAPAGMATLDEPVAERRVVSVMFADLVGFTAFAEGRDAEDVRETLSKYFDLSRDVIERYGGTVEKFIGDAVMALWGAPRAQEDDAERAVRAAMDLVENVPSLGPGIQARAAVLTGEAAVTIGATNQGMVAGDLVNTASRLQSVAPPGSVLVGESTHRASMAAITFEPAGEQLLKGKEAPVPAWRALRVVAERGGRNRTDALEAPFVGRHEEMRLLKDLFHTTGREKRLRVVSVIGPAGIGKSRLAWEFALYIDGLADDVYWHSGRSPAYGEGITFWALGEMVRERCGLLERDDEQTTRTKVAEAVAQWVSDDEERPWIERSLLTLLGVETGMAADQLFGAWRTFFERVAASGPVALVFEDMHFADAGLLDFVDHLLEWSRGLPIYVVTLARPDLIERRPDWGAGKRNFVSMYLEPLPEDEMRELLAGLVPGLPAKAVATIVARADGIPLYAVETVRTLVGEGRLVEKDGVYVPNGDLSELSIPDTLTALIASRLDSLDELDRRIVHDAAVLGQSFTVAALAAVADIPAADLEPRLGGLVRRELLRVEIDARSPERGQYEFVQALIREVAYNTLSKRDRKKLHLAAARYFEALGNDEIAGALASHYLAAQANAAEGDEADALAGQARIALKAAAARASALGSFDQAVKFSEQALSVTTDPADQVELLIQAAEDTRTAGRAEDGEPMLRRALELAKSTGDRLLIARATNALGGLLSFLFQTDEALALLEPAAHEFADLDDPVVTELNLNVARSLWLRNEPRRSLEILEKVLELAERQGLVELIALAFLSRSNALFAIGRRREAIGATRLARDIAAENGLIGIQIRAMSNLSGSMSDFDQRESLDGYADAIALARRTGQHGAVIGLVGNLGYAAFLGGEWDSGLNEMDLLLAEDLNDRDRLIMVNNATIIRSSRGEEVSDAFAEMERLGKGMSGNWHQFVADPIANHALVTGDLRTAHDSFLEISTDSGQEPEYLYRAARPSLWSGDVDQARALLRQLEQTGSYGAIADARAATVQAGIAALEGRSAEALSSYRDALRDWRSSHSIWDEALTGVDMALLLDPADPEVATAIESTREILERLGAKPYLDRLNEAAARNGATATPRTSAMAPAEVESVS